MLLILICSLAWDEVPVGRLLSDVRFDEVGDKVFTAQEAKSIGWNSKPQPLQMEKESFQLYVPKTYQPGTPHGVLVYISPGPKGLLVSNKFKQSDLFALVEKHRLIYVGANASQNEREIGERLQLAATALYNV